MKLPVTSPAPRPVCLPSQVRAAKGADGAHFMILCHVIISLPHPFTSHIHESVCFISHGTSGTRQRKGGRGENEGRRTPFCVVCLVPLSLLPFLPPSADAHTDTWIRVYMHTHVPAIILVRGRRAYEDVEVVLDGFRKIPDSFTTGRNIRK